MTSNSTTPPTPIAASPNRRPFTSADGGRAKPAAMIGPGKMRDVAPGGVDSGSDSTNRATDSAKVRARTRHVSSPLSKIEGSLLLARLEILDRWIASLAKSGINALHDDIVNFAALVKGRFSESLMNAFGQV
jgi:hypothetical protein